VLVNGTLRPEDVRTALVLLGLLAIPLAGVVLLEAAPTLDWRALSLMAAAAVLAVGYTVRPLRLVYRGLGEVDVALTHSVVVVIAGYVLQTGRLDDLYPWLLGVPLFVAILPSIILSAIPDYEADLGVGKRTLPVVLTRPTAVRVARAAAALAALLGVAWQAFGLLPGAAGWAMYLALAHGLLLSQRLGAFLKEGAPSRPIDALMVLSLSYVMWFVVVPLIAVW
jgi:1,4-dihydroxy-2-naphthoate octaprenyltransferase